MDIQIKNDASELIYSEQMDFPMPKFLSTSLIEEKQQLSYDFADARFKEIYFDGYHIAIGDIHIYENLHIYTTENIPTISLIFMLNGDFVAGPDMITGNFGKRRYQSLEHNLFFNPSPAENIDVDKQRGLELIALAFSTDRFLDIAANGGRVLDTLANDVAGGKGAYLNKRINPPITSRMLMVLEEIRRCQFTGGVKKLFLQSKALELLALQCEQYERVEQVRVDAVPISAADREKIHYAKDLLLKSMQNPPSLAELSRSAGLNEFKLKNGFRQVFDNTVFGYLNDHRMDYARKMIVTQEYSLTEIAEQLGFSSIQHFSLAFKKKFGVSPSKIK
ncbi:AraC family transcriptional regulator [Chitinophaga filiformis]|uniref:helix-turn-helix transcriptional regulator n=1 Tax=Chitinophaga filiformis TaxID=104663 RepID=UPI001F2ED095|nr:AraC family transcriptional regulator [Chitinophaga filiformis]MCF6404712.1 AraC family transcriptional regulator [Chitinophaga filiformis]